MGIATARVQHARDLPWRSGIRGGSCGLGARRCPESELAVNGIVWAAVFALGAARDLQRGIHVLDDLNDRLAKSRSPAR